MTRTTIAAASMLALSLAGPAGAQVTTGGAGNTGIPAPRVTGGVRAGGDGVAVEERAPPTRAPAGNAASPSNSSVPGTTPGVNIGGTPTSGPPGTGGAAGGPSLSGQ